MNEVVVDLRDNAELRRAQLDTMTLEELFEQACPYGLVSVSQPGAGDKLWYASIQFETSPGTRMQATSTFKEPNPKAALIAAIEAAETIRRQFR